MPGDEWLQRKIDQALNQQENHSWQNAASQYEQALGGIEKTKYSTLAHVQEKLSYCIYRAAFQAANYEEFRERMQQAREAYERARSFSKKSADEISALMVPRVNAMVKFIGYWLASATDEKKKMLEEYWNFTSEALKTRPKAFDAAEYGETFSQLSFGVLFKFALEWDFKARRQLLSKVISHGEEAIASLSSSEHSHYVRMLAQAYARTAFFLGVYDYYFLDLDEKGKEKQKAQKYWMEASKLSEEVAMLELLHPVFGGKLALGWGEGTKETLSRLDQALEQAMKTKDHLIVGWVLDWLVYHLCWSGAAVESKNKDEALRLWRKVLQYQEDAKKHYSVMSYISPRADAEWIEVRKATFLCSTLEYETDKEKKRNSLEEGLKNLSDSLELAKTSGYPEAIKFVHHKIGHVLAKLAKIEPDLKKKKKLLEKAAEHSSETIRLTEQLEPFQYWNRGAMQLGLASIRFELSQFVESDENRRATLKEALQDGKSGLNLLLKGISLYSESTSMPFGMLGSSQFQYAAALTEFHEHTQDNDHMREAIESFQQAAQSYEKVKLTSRIAECHWKIGQAYNVLGEHSKAAHSFSVASSYYESASKAIPQLKDFYRDHSLYMQAWNEIEEARHYHSERQHGLAEKHFERAAELHRSIERWNYLSPNYLAWARLEKAEALSRQESTEEAMALFKQAVTLFSEAKASIEAKLEELQDEEERKMHMKLMESSKARREYCLGRASLEEAKTLDRLGQHAASSEKYGSATANFMRATELMENGSEKNEMKPIVDLSKAWQAMTKAEAETSADLYSKASKLFETAKESSLSEKPKMLALGHSRFCKALAAATEFEESQDMSFHTLATQHLESAGRAYLKAGFKDASEYAEATQKLLDAYLYMGNAKAESDPAKQARYYLMAEKVLQASAGLYLQARHPEKQEQVSRLLEKVRKEKELALSLNQVLHAPLTTLTTTTFTTPAARDETSIGLERFEHADVQASIILKATEARVGDDVDLEIELTNAGKAPALLMEVERVTPENFELKKLPDTYRAEDHHINMKGRKLDPLKTEEIKMTVKPWSKGTFTVNPRIHYIDESGTRRSHQPEPVSITVRELGISGWIKGKR